MLAMAAVGGSQSSRMPTTVTMSLCVIPVEHDAAAHRIGASAVDADSHPLHCVVCHWVRAFRPGVEARFVAAPHQARRYFHAAVVTISGRAPRRAASASVASFVSTLVSLARQPRASAFPSRLGVPPAPRVRPPIARVSRTLSH